jgi:hypothetical protein
MTATRPRPNGKRAFLFALVAAVLPNLAGGADPGWRVTVVPSFEPRPAVHEAIPGSQTTFLAVARSVGYGELEYATTRGSWRAARQIGETDGGRWLVESNMETRRDARRVIDRILITGEDPLLPALALTPAFYTRFEPLLGDGFHVIIPDRNTIAMYPRLAGRIPPEEAAALLEINRLATYPVSREVFRANREGLVADGILGE